MIIYGEPDHGSPELKTHIKIKLFVYASEISMWIEYNETIEDHASDRNHVLAVRIDINCCCDLLASAILDNISTRDLQNILAFSFLKP